MDVLKVAKSSRIFSCNLCDYNTCKKSNYDKHLKTSKHIICWTDNNGHTSSKNNPTKQSLYKCSCGKEYAHHSGLCKHKKKCILSQNTIINSHIHAQNEDEVGKKGELEKEVKTEELTNQFTVIVKLFQEQMQENKELRQLLIDQNKQMMDLASKASANNVTNNTTNNNQQFNLHIFLNEKCKDAMNITDFVENIKVQLADLEVFGTHGYCEGITRVFLRYLNEMDICKRPIHCSDLKREIMYVKDNDVWEKDDERKLIKKAIDKIERKNHLIIPAWQVANPEFNQYDSKVNDVYNKLLIEAMGGETKEENDKNYSKITRCIAKGTIITKNPY